MLFNRLANDGRRDATKEGARELGAEEPGVKSGVADPDWMGDAAQKEHGVEGVAGLSGLPEPCM